MSFSFGRHKGTCGRRTRGPLAGGHHSPILTGAGSMCAGSFYHALGLPLHHPISATGRSGGQSAPATGALIRTVRRWGNLSDRAFPALVMAWIIIAIATTLLGSVLALASVWDGAVFFHALRAALSSEL
jgi:hypothetical protein